MSRKKPTFNDTIASSLALLRANLSRLKREMRANGGGFDPAHAKQAVMISRGLALLGAEDRQRAKKAYLDSENLTWAEQADDIVECYELLPPEHRKAVRLRMLEKFGADVK